MNPMVTAQKRFTVDFLTKKMKINRGEVPQYIIEHSHDAIIEPQEWDAVQAEFARRKSLGHQYSGKNVLATKIVCGDCGGFYGSKVWHSTSKYRRTIWQCNQKFKGEGQRCSTPHLDEDDVKARFLTAFNSLLSSKEQFLDDCRLIQTILTDCTEIDRQIAVLLQELEVITELTGKCISENSKSAQSQQDYAERYNAYVERYETAKAKLEKLEREKASRAAKADAIGGFAFALSEREEVLTEFDDRLWFTVLDKVVAHADGRLVFKFLSGAEVEA